MHLYINVKRLPDCCKKRITFTKYSKCNTGAVSNTLKNVFETALFSFSCSAWTGSRRIGENRRYAVPIFLAAAVKRSGTAAVMLAGSMPTCSWLSLLLGSQLMGCHWPTLVIGVSREISRNQEGEQEEYLLPKKRKRTGGNPFGCLLYKLFRTIVGITQT